MLRGLTFLLLLAAAGLGVKALVEHGQPEQPEKAAYITTPVERGDLITTITSAGTVPRN